MTLSNETRKHGMRDALRLMLEGVGDSVFSYRWFEVARQGEPVEPFTEIPWPTTWDDLEANGYIRPQHAMGVQIWGLTGSGWIAALKVTKNFNTEEHQHRVIALRRALVDANKGRPAHGTLISFDELAQASELPIGWVTNAILSQLLVVWFNDREMQLEIVHRQLIRVSPRFAAPHLHFDPDET